MAANNNPRGQQRAKPYREALQRAIARAEQSSSPHALDRIADNHLRQCAKGDMSAIKELADRIDGKVPTPVVGDSDHPGVIDPRTFFAWMKDTSKDTSQESNSLVTIDESSDLPRSSHIAAPEKPSLQ